MSAMDVPAVLRVNGKEYAVLRLLGKGKGGYTWLAERDGARYALKQIHHEPCDYYQFGDKLAAELRDHQRLSALRVPIPALLDVDRAAERLLKELIPGETISSCGTLWSRGIWSRSVRCPGRCGPRA